MKKNNHLEEPLLLLGTGRKYLIFRQKVKDELIAKGYKNIIIMEEVEDKDDKSLDSKFDRIINENKPSLIFVFFQNGASTDGITLK